MPITNTDSLRIAFAATIVLCGIALGLREMLKNRAAFKAGKVTAHDYADSGERAANMVIATVALAAITAVLMPSAS